MRRSQLGKSKSKTSEATSKPENQAESRSFKALWAMHGREFGFYPNSSRDPYDRLKPGRYDLAPILHGVRKNILVWIEIQVGIFKTEDADSIAKLYQERNSSFLAATTY